MPYGSSGGKGGSMGGFDMGTQEPASLITQAAAVRVVLLHPTPWPRPQPRLHQ